ncbi:MAG TPA: hypothetical protein VG815_07215 [Chloroflexota bacterium]|jgi:hypothetical protein|nr:hypothetical protein [Chloroflexota bacterium]
MSPLLGIFQLVYDFDRAPDNRFAFRVIDPDEDDATSMELIRVGPLSQKRNEVLGVKRHHDTSIGSRHLKKSLIVETVKVALLIGRPNIESQFSKPDGYAPTG